MSHLEDHTRITFETVPDSNPGHEIWLAPLVTPAHETHIRLVPARDVVIVTRATMGKNSTWTFVGHRVVIIDQKSTFAEGAKLHFHPGAGDVFNAVLVVPEGCVACIGDGWTDVLQYNRTTGAIDSLRAAIAIIAVGMTVETWIINVATTCVNFAQPAERVDWDPEPNVPAPAPGLRTESVSPIGIVYPDPSGDEVVAGDDVSEIELRVPNTQ